jgi:GT2 family glycosyltransferase
MDYPTSALEIVVIDNASNDGTVEAIKQTYPQINLLCNKENLGGTGGFNRGLQWAFEQPLERYHYLWLLDNDVLVHRRALTELVTLLESKPNAAIAGSTMMQLDYPWRINEMGAFVDRTIHAGHLILNRHLETIPAWQGRSVQELLTMDADLSKYLLHCQPFMDVEYVAAASLLIRAEVARKAGLWRDYFIHYDDVEWCLRINAMGYRVLVSAKSLIWHLSAIAKVPTWVLYYDNRNVLDLLKNHGASTKVLHQMMRFTLKKAVYYHLLGKPDLARLHQLAVTDFQAQRFGKKADIHLDCSYQKNSQIQSVLLDPSIKKILLAWPVNVHATGIQEALVQAQLQRPELQIDCMPLPNGEMVYQLPHPHFIKAFPPNKFQRWLTYWKLRGSYDLIIQSDYHVVIGLSWLKSRLLFINDEGFCERPRPKVGEVIKAVWRYYMSSLFL